MSNFINNLNTLYAGRDRLVNKLKAKGLPASQNYSLNTLIDMVADAEYEDEYQWIPPSDWFDIETIFNNDIQANYTKRYIWLLNDMSATTAFAGGTAYKTSDGAFYTSSTVTHTWNTALDKDCAEGYKTRWVIVYSNASTVACSLLPALNPLYVYFGECVLSSFAFNSSGSSGSRGVTLRAIKVSNLTSTNFTILADYALYSLFNLEYLELPSGLQKLAGTSSLAVLYALKKLKLPNTFTDTTNIGYLYSLQTLELPATITILGTSTYYFLSLKRISFSEGITAIPVSFLNTNNPSGNFGNLKEITIPNSVTNIGNYAFGSNTTSNPGIGLKKITLSNNLLDIGTYAFGNCTNLKEITIPNSVTSIGDNCFNNCTTLEKVEILSNSLAIGLNAFLYCYNLQYLNVPAGFNSSLQLSTCNRLRPKVLTDIFTNLIDLTGQTAKTLTLGTINLAKLSNTQKAIATSKNWTLA